MPLTNPVPTGSPRMLAAASGIPSSTGAPTFSPTSSGAGEWVSNAVTGTPAVAYGLDLAVGQTLNSVSAYVVDGGSGAGPSVTLRVFKVDMGSGTYTLLGSASSSGTGGSSQTLTVSGLTEIVANGFGYYAVVYFSTLVTGAILRGAKLVFS